MASTRSKMKRPRPTYEIAELFPMQGDWTEEEYLALDTNRLVELSDGKLDLLPHPTSFHQFVLGCLVASILPHVEAQRLGRVLISAFPVRLWPGTFREPDLIFMSAAHRDRCGEEYWGSARSRGRSDGVT